MRRYCVQLIGYIALTAQLLLQVSCVATQRDVQPTPAELRAASASEAAAFDAILALYEEYDLVHIGERHWYMTDFDFRVALVRYPAFAETVDDIVIESGSSLHQDLLDAYILELKDVPPEELCQVWRDTTIPNGVWDATIYKEFIHAVREVNEKLPASKRIRMVAAEPPIDWSRVTTGEDVSPFFCARSTHPVKVVQSEVLSKNRKALIIYGGAHFYRTSNIVPVAGRLRAGLEAVMEGRVFVIQPLSGDDAQSRRFAEAAGVDEVPFFLDLRRSKLASMRGDLFFGEAEGTLGDFTDGVLFFGAQPNREATLDPAAANDAAYQKERERRHALFIESTSCATPGNCR